MDSAFVARCRSEITSRTSFASQLDSSLNSMVNRTSPTNGRRPIESVTPFSSRRALKFYGSRTNRSCPLSKACSESFDRRLLPAYAAHPPSRPSPTRGEGASMPARTSCPTPAPPEAHSDEIHPVVAQRTFGHRRARGKTRRQAHNDRARGRDDRGQGEGACAVHD